MMKVVAVFALVAAVAVSAYGISTQRSLPSTEARNGEVRDVNFGLSVSVRESDVAGRSDVHATWNQIQNAPTGSILAVTLRTKAGASGRISDFEDRIVDISSASKDFVNQDLPDGLYYIQLRLVPPSGNIQRQIYSFSIPQGSESSRNLFSNSSFEDGIIPSENHDRDPVSWVIKEGVPTLNANGGETGDIVEEYPRMTQVVAAEYGVRPHSGSYMLKNATDRGVKSQFRQIYLSPIESGTFVQKLSMFIPSQAGFLQQMEFRRGLESFHMRWTESFTNIRLRTGPTNDESFSKRVAAFPMDRWNEIVITLNQVTAGVNQWRIRIELNGDTIFRSNGGSVPDIFLKDGLIGQIFVGDEGAGIQGAGEHDGFGTIYFDDVEAYNY